MQLSHFSLRRVSRSFLRCSAVGSFYQPSTTAFRCHLRHYCGSYCDFKISLKQSVLRHFSQDGMQEQAQEANLSIKDGASPSVELISYQNETVPKTEQKEGLHGSRISPTAVSTLTLLKSVEKSFYELAILSGTAEEIERAFRCSVEARTIGNAHLRRYLLQLLPKDYELGLAALKGVKEAGLRVSTASYEALLELLIKAGQLKVGLELHQNMLRLRMTPTPHSYALLMQLCLQRQMIKECQTLFKDMQRRGVKPSWENYELMIKSLAAESPPQWELAIKIFDKLSHEHNSPRINSKVYNALMTVYVNMEPFDWRVVYNCYYEMRSRRPRIPLEWDSYLILRGALIKGKAGYMRRFLAFFDAWVATTDLGSFGFFKGLLVYFTVMWIIKSIVGYFFVHYLYSTSLAKNSAPGESILPS